MISSDRSVQLIQFHSTSGWQILPAHVISEASVSLTVNGEVWLAFMCTPNDLEALAIGFLFNEGIIESQAEIGAASVCACGENVDVWLHKNVQKPKQWRRTSGCTGGITSIEDHSVINTPPSDETFISAEMILESMDQLLQVQDLYREARGVHCAAISDGKRIIVRAEDIGRHNTLDKLAGMMLMNPVEMERKIILTTGRISSEMLQKSNRLGASVLVSRTSPTSLSVQLADEMGITLIGYARRNQFLVYAHPERMITVAEAKPQFILKSQLV
jgi:FdhD protein